MTARRRRKQLRDATHPGTEAGEAARRAGGNHLKGRATQGAKAQVRSHGRWGQPAANEERGERDARKFRAGMMEGTWRCGASTSTCTHALLPRRKACAVALSFATGSGLKGFSEAPGANPEHALWVAFAMSRSSARVSLWRCPPNGFHRPYHGCFSGRSIERCSGCWRHGAGGAAAAQGAQGGWNVHMSKRCCAICSPPTLIKLRGTSGSADTS